MPDLFHQREGWTLYCQTYGLVVKYENNEPVLTGMHELLEAHVFPTKEAAEAIISTLQTKCYTTHDDPMTNMVQWDMVNPANWTVQKATITAKYADP
jgi:hypothetical protein